MAIAGICALQINGLTVTRAGPSPAEAKAKT
jgi:hypothetical protein